MNDISLLHIALIYLAVINVVTFFVYGIDKWKAKKFMWRVSEATLLGLAVVGGSIGACPCSTSPTARPASAHSRHLKGKASSNQ